MKSDRLIYKDKWYYYNGRKYFHKDIDMLADMRRKGINGGTLEGKELIEFVMACLTSADYQVLGLEVPDSEVPDVFNCPNCNEEMTYNESDSEWMDGVLTTIASFICPKCSKVIYEWEKEFEFPDGK